MKKSASWAPAPNLKVLAVEWNETDWVVSVTGQDHATCPVCGTRSSSRHSSYRQTLQDLQAQGTPVTVRARMIPLNEGDLHRERSRPHLSAMRHMRQRTRGMNKRA